MTQKQLFAKALAARGAQQIAETPRYQVWQFPNSGNKIYLGTAGACRIGPTRAASVPLSPRARQMLLNEGAEAH